MYIAFVGGGSLKVIRDVINQKIKYKLIKGRVQERHMQQKDLILLLLLLIGRTSKLMLRTIQAMTI